MRIYKFVLIWIVVFGLIATVLATGFYLVERNLLLHTLADSLNRSLYRLEIDIAHGLESGRLNEVQQLLDETPAINKTIAVVSVSIDGHVIDVSSSRSLKGKVVGEQYHSISSLDKNIFKNYAKYRSDFYFFEGTHKHDAALLAHIDEEYVFGRLNQVATYYAVLIFFVIGFGSVVAFLLMRRLLILPLDNVIKHARDASTVGDAYLISEFSELDNTLCDSFDRLRHQQEGLQSALNDALYLDRILRTVADINQLLISSQNIDELLTLSSARLAEHTGYKLCWIGLADEDCIKVKAFSSDAKGDLAIGMIMARLTEHADDAVSRAFLQGTPTVIDHLETRAITDPWQLVTVYGKCGSFIALPLIPRIHEQPVGVLGLYTQNSNGFAHKEIEMLEELAGDIGFAIRAFTQRKQLEYHLTRDSLTELPNRTSLVDQLAINSSVTLAIINIDRFSDINDVYGSHVGDCLLVNYGRWLLHQIEAHDGISLYKMSGDEYVLSFTGWNNLDACCEFLENLILLSAKESFVVNDIEVLLTITIGVAEASERVLAHASSAIKQAKLMHQRLQVYSNASTIKDQESNISWYKRIKAAIDDSRIVPYFQPIVDNKTRNIIKYEALIRLIEKDGSVISPYAFLDMAKKMRMYGQLTTVMVEKTCAIFKNSTIPVSINLSTEDLLNAELADMIEKTILSNGMAQTMIFEILESEGIENYTEVSAFVDRFKSLGCRFAIDDFGSGYSNFDHLLKLSVDTIKIDASLIKNLQHDRNARIFVQHICDFAHEMGITTVAEFVANEDIYLRVKDIGIDASQGYYFYAPSPHLVAE
ncbi:cyclic di-GMP phosphodiesterase CdpA [mine drainage metagenome]|uniref:Cyclic di-GMP phosphodiesterase CdpA n=1 Tax=mine drainage metagenome TaxID=410659 RepID=A0A1J5SRK5_9ZZZZ